MTHPEIDPSLCAAEPVASRLDDGFSPPADAHPAPPPHNAPMAPAEPVPSPKSPF